MLFSPAFVELFAPGFHAVPGKFELATQLVRTMFPFLLLVALAAQAQGILFACHQFGIPAVFFQPVQYRLGGVRARTGILARSAPRHQRRCREWRTASCSAAPRNSLFQLPSVWRAGFRMAAAVESASRRRAADSAR